MKYYCDRHQGVEAQSASEAAHIIAQRKARSEFGGAGLVGACRVDGQSEDGKYSECEAFIGYRTSRDKSDHSISGRNVRFSLHLK